MRALAPLALVLAAGYLLIVGLLTALQGRLVYPSAGQGSAPDAALLSALGYTALPASGAVRAYVAEPDSARGTVVVFHGNGGTALDRGYYVRALTARGVRVVLAEYPGYGGRPGRPSEAVLVEDAVETLRMVSERYPGPLVVWGESLGAGVAAAAVARAGDLADGVVLLTPWDTLTETAARVYPWLPVRLLLRDRYDSVSNLAGYDGPVAVLVAEADRVIPAERGLALYEALGEPKRLWTFEGVGHNSWPADPEGAWWDEVLGFVLPR